MFHSHSLTLTTQKESYQFSLICNEGDTKSEIATLWGIKYTILHNDPKMIKIIQEFLDKANSGDPSLIEFGKRLKEVSLSQIIRIESLSKNQFLCLNFGGEGSVGNKENVDHKLKKTEHFLKNNFHKWQFEFLGIISIKQGNQIFASSFHRIGSSIIDCETSFNILSLGQWFTAIGILKLVQSELLTLETEVFTILDSEEEYILSNFHQASLLVPKKSKLKKMVKEIRENRVTIMQLLKKTAGIVDGKRQLLPKGIKISHHKHKKSLINTTSDSKYCYQLLARIIEKLSRRSFYNFITQEIFEKSALLKENVSRAISTAPPSDFARLYQKLCTTNPKIEKDCFPEIDGSGGFWLDSSDLLKISSTLMESERILSKKWRKIMLDEELGIKSENEKFKDPNLKLYRITASDCRISGAIQILIDSTDKTPPMLACLFSNQSDGYKSLSKLTTEVLNSK